MNVWKSIHTSSVLSTTDLLISTFAADSIFFLRAGVFTLTGLILFGSEINRYPEETKARIAWSFGMCVLSLLFTLATSGLVLLDRKLESYSAASTPDSVSLDLYLDQDDGYRY